MPNRIINRFRENSRGFWKKYKWLIVIFALAIILDSCSTIYFMIAEGTEIELHPAVRFLSTRILGPILGPVFSVICKVSAGIIVAIYCRKFAPYIFLAASIISVWAAWYNIWGYKIYTLHFLKYVPW